MLPGATGNWYKEESMLESSLYQEQQTREMA